MRRSLGTFLVCLSMPMIACGGGPQLGRIGSPVPLANGTPRTSCEAQGWYDVIPTRIETTTARGGGYVTTYYHQVHEGVGVYKTGGEDPEDLEKVWPSLHDDPLQKEHQRRIQPVDDANARAMAWLLGSLGVMVGGVGTAAAIQGESKSAALAFGLGGVGLGVVGLIIGLTQQPSAPDEMAADARRKLFFPGEDDLRAAARDVDASNGRRRVACGGVAVDNPGAVIPEKRRSTAPAPETAPPPSSAAPNAPPPPATEPKPESNGTSELTN